MKSGTAAASRFRTFWRRFVSLHWPRGLAILVCGMLGISLPAMYGLHAGVREPVVHDEFSYLLAADTFAHGRLSNPSPSHPEFFEAPHILVVPSYGSKYPPGQGLMLAIGQVVGRRPIWGVWLSCGVFAAALCWMLQAWSSPPWALATTCLAIATCGVSSYWAQSYWGGMAAATGGALLFGALRRTLRAPRMGSSILMGAGVIVLANTRPFEGIWASLIAGVPLAIWLFGDRSQPLTTKVWRWLLPFVTVLVVGAAGMVSYNRAVTGSWLLPPYVLHEQQYFDQGVFRFSSEHPPGREPAPRVAAFYASYKATPQRGLKLVLGTAEALYRILGLTVDTAMGMTLETRGSSSARLWLLALIATISWRARWVWFCIGGLGFVVLGASLIWWWFPHYVAPVYPLEIAVFAVTLRRADLGSRTLQPSRRLAPLVVTILAALFLGLPMAQHAIAARVGLSHEAKPSSTESRDSSSRDSSSRTPTTRSSIKQLLEREPGRHLVFVQYDPDYDIHDEWVYNGADLPGSRILFAHDLGAVKNSLLVADSPGRSLWLLRVGKKETRLDAYR
jgi:hypothetical protein